MKSHPLCRALAVVTKLVTQLTVRWVGCAPIERQRIYFANHTSHLDSLVIWAALPESIRARTRPIAASDYWSRGIRRFLAEQVFRAILIGRHSDLHEGRSTINKILEGIGETQSLIIFPEGTRGDGENIAAFKSGIFHLVEQRQDIELVPVYIDNACRVLPKGEVFPVPFITTVIFGSATHYDEREGRHAFLERMRSSLIALMPNRGNSDTKPDIAEINP